jgi:hypothetical protein
MVKRLPTPMLPQHYNKMPLFTIGLPLHYPFPTGSTLCITGWQWNAAELPVRVDAVVMDPIQALLSNN